MKTDPEKNPTKKLKIALIGYGKMGQMVEKAALERGHTIKVIIDSSNAFCEKDLNDVDICIDFTHPSQVLPNIAKIAPLQKNIVIGTTGWESDLEDVKKIAENFNIGILHEPNFSIGMHLFLRILQQAAKQIYSTGKYDVSGIEMHHNQKLDAPSGTAKAITKQISEATDGKLNIPFTSIRCGAIPGIHQILFDSKVDTLTFTHEARSREGFAEGAVIAAEWLFGKTGFFNLDSVLEQSYAKH